MIVWQYSRRTLIGGCLGLAFPGSGEPLKGFSVLDFGSAENGDITKAAQTALDHLARAGGGTLTFPANGGQGWNLSKGLWIRSSNTHIRLLEDVNLRTTTPSSVFTFSGSSRTAPSRNVSITGVGRSMNVDGNGRSIRGYSYNIANTFYSCILFLWCEYWEARNINGYNGLVNCLRSYQCGAGSFTDCSASASRYDNGISIDFDPTPSPGSKPPDRLIVRARVKDCAGFGITAYAARGVQIIDPIVVACGNDDPDAPVSGGGISVEGNYKTPSISMQDLKVKIVKPKVYNCYNAGIFITARGALIESPLISGTKTSHNRDNSMGEKGSGIYCVGSGTATVHNGKIMNSEGNGITVIDNISRNPGISFTGDIIGSRRYGVFRKGSGLIGLPPPSKILNSGISDRNWL